MIEYDYLLVRDEGDEKCEYRPAGIPKKIPNLIQLEGPNSLGKTTLLNIMAGALYGAKNEGMDVGLKRKIGSLLQSKHQKLTFSVKISKEDESLLLQSSKDNPDTYDFKVEEISKDGKKRYLDKENFEKRYNLIYDIPRNPTERIADSIEDIKDIQTIFGNKVGSLYEHIRKLTTEIANSKDPKRIAELKKTVQDYHSKIEITKEGIKKLENELDIVESYTYNRFYVYYRDKHAEIERQIERKEKELNRYSKQKTKKESSCSKHKEDLQAEVKEYKKTFDELTSLLDIIFPKEAKQEKEVLDFWKKIDVARPLKEYEVDSRLERILPRVKKILENVRDSKSEDEATREAELLKELIEVLRRYEAMNLIVPGANRTVVEFIDELNKSYKEKEAKVAVVNNIDKAIENVESLIPSTKVLKNLSHMCQEEAKHLSEEDEEEAAYEQLDNNLIELGGERNEYARKRDEYEEDYIVKHKPTLSDIKGKDKGGIVQECEVLTEDQLKGKIEELRRTVNMEKSNENDYRRKYDIYSAELSSLERKEPHKYLKKVDQLNSLLKKTEILNGKLNNTYAEYLRELKNFTQGKKISKEQVDYNEAIFTYLGRRLGKFKHIKEEYTATKVDLSQQVIMTTKGKIIHFDDMGTGQSQSAYLLSKLNTPDDRKIIALFDEIAMMDKHSLAPVYTRIKELYKSGKLLAAIVVQKGEKFNMIPIR